MAGNPFDSTSYDLGGYSPYKGAGMPPEQVGDFITSGLPHCTCYVCHQQAHFRLMPKKPEYNTAELSKGVFICNHCAAQSIADSDKYGLRPL